MKKHSRFLLVSLLGCCLFCTGCQTLREAKEAKDPAKLKPGERTVTAQELGLTAERTLTLEELEKMALIYAPSVVVARQNLRQAWIAAKEAGVSELPSISLSGNYSRSTNNQNRHDQSTHTDGSWGASLSMKWTIYDFGRTRAAVKRAKATFRAAEQSLKNAESAALLAVRKAFFDLKRAQELDAVAAETVAQYQEHYERVKIQNEIGKSTRYDLIKAEVDLHTAQLSKVTTEHQVKNGWGTLNQAIGLAEQAEYKLGEGKIPEYLTLAGENPLESLAAQAKKQDPVLASRIVQTEAAMAYVNQMTSELYPSLGVNLAWSFSGENLSTPWLWQLAGGASMTQALFASGSNLRKIQTAVSELKSSYAQRAAREQELFQLVRSAVLSAQLAVRQCELAQLTEESARQNLDIVNERYQQGKASSVERTDAQVDYSTARVAVVKASYDRLDALAVIANLLGE